MLLWVTMTAFVAVMVASALDAAQPDRDGFCVVVNPSE
jgi:hypothetical protein